MFATAFHMKSSSLIRAASVSVLGLAAAWAEPTAPVDPALRNTPFSPAATIVPETKSPVIDAAVQDKRVEKTTIEKKPAAVGDRRAAIEVQETRDKNVREKNSRRPAVVEQPMSALNGREANISTDNKAAQPPIVSKYQDSMKAASATALARFPAVSNATTAKINRFVFRKNSSDPAPVTGDAPVTPAGGGSPVSK
jgi:hypothetical protein